MKVEVWGYIVNVVSGRSSQVHSSICVCVSVCVSTLKPTRGHELDSHKYRDQQTDGQTARAAPKPNIDRVR